MNTRQPPMELMQIGRDGSEVRRFPLRNGEMLIGRRPDCNIVLDAPAVAPRHARVFSVDGRSVVYGFGEDWPVYVNDVPVTRYVLAHGDVIELAHYRLCYVEHDVSAPAVDASPDEAQGEQPAPEFPGVDDDSSARREVEPGIHEEVGREIDQEETRQDPVGDAVMADAPADESGGETRATVPDLDAAPKARGAEPDPWLVNGAPEPADEPTPAASTDDDATAGNLDSGPGSSPLEAATATEGTVEPGPTAAPFPADDDHPGHAVDNDPLEEDPVEDPAPARLLDEAPVQDSTTPWLSEADITEALLAMESDAADTEPADDGYDESDSTPSETPPGDEPTEALPEGDQPPVADSDAAPPETPRHIDWVWGSGESGSPQPGLSPDSSQAAPAAGPERDDDASSALPVHLDILSGINQGRRVTLTSDTVVLGFNQERLVEIRRTNGTLWVKRIAEHAEAQLNGETISDESTTAGPGDVLSVQRIELRIHQGQ